MKDQKSRERSARHWRNEGKFGPRGVFLSLSDLCFRSDGRQKRAALKAARELCADVVRGLH